MTYYCQHQLLGVQEQSANQSAEWLQAIKAKATDTVNLALVIHGVAWAVLLDLVASFQCQAATPAQLDAFFVSIASVTGSFAAAAILKAKREIQ